VRVACVGIAAGFVVVFSGPFSGAPAIVFTLGLVVLLTSYSLATILLYGFGREFNGQELREISVNREIGIVAGIILGSATPSVFQYLLGADRQYFAFGLSIAALSLIAGFAGHSIGTSRSDSDPNRKERFSFDRKIRPLVALALVNSLPVGMTATLFLFYVEDALQLVGYGGFLLAAFFLAAALSVPLWSGLSVRIGVKPTLTISMSLAIFSFIGAALLSPSTAELFWLVCLASGAAIGADMILLPVLFTAVLIRERQPAGQAFGMWFLASKLSLALAAAAVLPLLDRAGFQPGKPNAGFALGALVILYAVVPSALKFLALMMVRSLPQEVYAK
jgi:Na+/melibiose symporter-like transporter